MQKRKFGNSNLEVSVLGLSYMSMSFGDKPVGDKQEMLSLIRSAVERLFIFFEIGEVNLPQTRKVRLVSAFLASVRCQGRLASKSDYSQRR